MKQGSVGDKISQFCIVLFLTLWGLLILYPFYNSLLVSLVRQETYIKTPFMIFPKEITFESYAYVFRSQYIWSGYKVTLFVVVVGVTYSLFLTVTMAYALSRKYFPGKNFVLNLIIITMFFSGGLVPYYLLVKSLHLIDSVFSMIIPQGVNTFYMLILRNYFQTIPESLEESAKIDGANDFIILFRIMLPVATPVLATITLFLSVDRWNEWFNAMLFIKDYNKQPLQLALMRIIQDVNNLNVGGSPAAQRKEIFTDGVKMASIFVVMTPVMLVYPFVQRYFVKGIIIGAVKG
ncbi:binding-protein-dependent transport systems inner membrane component [Caldicellulosiruptor saccharolyticus DSM 8903]|uniref:Binding-protein-dependent transport systems inner membrane component n=1 Tax=Caldicellulosiruptor saccharolyticus (strain ATCC 43494 / DSM 8903 / Tp8T 6331) TaxID=351627 RepID=A4XMH0_CALS8|nr:ABC transporter permease subunit [Caldicellulosiruptor saccharolyticus]ABP68105.1 binding-protein-dependent transport systems inner membrane component [Caldicellulosiruptor saccharolyticus DSM 8903]